MAGRKQSAADLIAALRQLPAIEREVFLAMLDDDASYPVIAARLGIAELDAERSFAGALVKLADALDAPPPGPVVRRLLRRIAAAARLAQRATRR